MLTSAVARVARSLVYVTAAKDDPGQHCGTGFVVSRAGHIVTARHLVSRARRVEASLVGGPREMVCDIVDLDERTDVALLQAHADDLHAVDLHTSEPAAVGREVAFMGFPYSDVFDPPLAMTMRGIIGNRYGLGGIERYVIDATLAEGMSGGPLFLTDAGVTIGMVGARFDPARTRAKLRGVRGTELPSERTNITFAIGTEYVLPLLKRHAVPLQRT